MHTDAGMHIEILTFDGCPHADATRECVQRALSLERADATIDIVEVQTAETAQSLRFLGSPSVRINGSDAEPAARTRTEYGLMCRTYGGDTDTAGVPSMELIRRAIRQALRDGSESRDLLRSGGTALAIYWLPAMAIVGSGFFAIPALWRGALWAVALGTMGTGCVVNALQCRRVHCYVTGPFLLLGAIVALLYGLGVISPGKYGWNALALVLLAGTPILYYVPERIFGTYRGERAFETSSEERRN